MGKTREKQPSRSMKPVFVVFCEGETEEAYLDFIKQTYRSPFKIIPKVEGGKITQHLIRTRCREVKISRNEKIQVFLMYDMDKLDITAKLLQLKAHLLLSNPCIELWFLLHCKDQKAEISTEDTQKALKHTRRSLESLQETGNQFSAKRVSETARPRSYAKSS